MSLFLPHEQAELLVERHGLDPWVLSDRAWALDTGLATVMREWGSQPLVDTDPRLVCPIGMHADGVSYSSTSRVGSSKSVLVASWNMIGSEIETNRARRFLFFGVPKASCCQCGCEGFGEFRSDLIRSYLIVLLIAPRNQTLWA